MFRCIFAEILSLGGGHALRGDYSRAAVWAGAVVVCVALALWTPWAVLLMVPVRIASIIDAGRLGRRGPIGGRWHWKAAALFLVVSFGFLISARANAIELFKVPSQGMSPTIVTGDMIVGDKLSLLWRSPSRGDVVVYRLGRIDFVGRIVATGGDVVAVRNGVVHLNGNVEKGRTPQGSEALDFPTETLPCDVHTRTTGPFVGASLTSSPDGLGCQVPPNTMFVVGDNRADSNDSRSRGAFPISSVRARIVGVWLGSRIGAVD